jgi:aldose 1-epimerase
VSDDRVLLRCGEARLAVNPARGGRIDGFWWDDAGQARHWLRPATPLRPASFVMVPYASRIRAGRFAFGGRQIHLRANNPPEPHSIHGHGFQQPWQALNGDDAQLLLEYVHTADSWPWSYRVQQYIELRETSLLVRVSVGNLSKQTMPVGIGLHPYFVSTPDCRVQASVNSRWQLDEERLPIGSCASGRDRADTVLFRGGNDQDAFYSGWDGEAVLELPELGARIGIQASLPLRHLVVFADNAAQAVCVEPVSNVVDAFNLAPDDHPGELYQVLQPGEDIAAEVCITPEVY